MATATYSGITDASGNANIYRKVSGTETALILGLTGYGVDFKAWGALAAEYMMWDNSASQLQINTTPASGDSSRALYIVQSPISTTSGIRQGAVYIYSNRTASYAWATWDGNPDCGIKAQIYNRSVSAANGAVRGIDILARNRDSGSCSWLNGGYFCAENSTGSGGVVNVIGLETHAKNNGVASGDVKCLRVYDESQSSTGTSYGIELNCTGDSGFAREYGLYIGAGSTASWTNAISFNDTITNVFDFENSDGTNGATLKAGTYSGSGNTIKIQLDCAGVAYYLIAHATVT
ncbi:MAG: hypothetical protein KJ604_20530 [Gammaproteobacteria bacterium]|nr:hypothetical protein [Gammaproteobacteria bacterium]